MIRQHDEANELTLTLLIANQKSTGRYDPHYELSDTNITLFSNHWLQPNKKEQIHINRWPTVR